MRFLSVTLSIVGYMAIGILATPTGDLADVENIAKRGCGTGSWCCTVAKPSTYCANWCHSGIGSDYI